MITTSSFSLSRTAHFIVFYFFKTISVAEGVEKEAGEAVQAMA